MRGPRTAAAVLILGASLACARARRPVAPPPVILISIDTLRADHLPAYGSRAVETPAIDALRRDAVLFANAWSQVPLTLPSHATILTGLLPSQHGVRDNVGFRLSPKRATLATLLAARGYACGAAVSSLALRADRGLTAGFGFYDDRFDADSPDERPGDRTAQRLETWMDSVSGRPVFAFLHLYEPHAPYTPPEPFRTRYASTPYDGEIAAADATVGRFLEFVKLRNLYDRALVILLSDHGEGLGDHGEDEHGVFLYREALRVPLLVKLPFGREKGRSVASPVGLIDVLPTVVAFAGTAAPAGLPGLNLFGSSAPPADRTIYAETLYPRLALGLSDLASVIDARFQYIEAPKPEIYDLIADPSERRNLVAEKPPALRTLRLALAGVARAPAVAEPTSQEEISKLASLGYISVSRGASAGPLPDPKDHIETIRKYKRLFEAFYARRDAEAATLAREIVRDSAAVLSAWRMLAKVQQRGGDLAAAVQSLKKGLAAAGNASSEEIEQTVSQLAGSLDSRGAALAQAARLRDAKRVFLEAEKLQPSNLSVRQHLAMLALRENDPKGARDRFEAALRLSPSSPGLWAGLGLARVRLEDEAGAEAAWRRAVELDATQYDALFNLGVLCGRLGRREPARQALKRFVATAPAAAYAGKLAQARRILDQLSQSRDEKPSPR